ncbi:unnamed protein product [Ectocarpus sp. CCAP 1310/34]|nr:unnamed protein product [Ectocarpus sp. CCAP 1310/34]
MSFTIELVGDEIGGGGSLPDWEPNSSFRFIYVWICSKDQILIAEVVGDGSNNGTLTATYQSDFPGDYLVHVEEVQPSKRGEGLPIVGSPFSLTITGDGPTLDVDSLPVCGSQDDGSNDIADTFWRPGTWLSSNVASAAHGVMRNGWVFQPKSCVFDTFSYQDLMLLASLDGEPTWLVVVGGSVQRGVFLTLVDMALAAGQKDDMATSVLQKCWGYADLRVGNLRLTYQDMRLYQVSGKTDSVVCNNEKLTSGSTAAFVHSAKEFLASTAFRDGTQWPATILAPSYLVPENNVNQMIEAYIRPASCAHAQVLMDSLPPSWEGKLLFVDHMAGFRIHWTQGNPTRTALMDVRITATGRTPTDDFALRKMDGYQTQDPRVSFISAFPVSFAERNLFENERSRQGIRHYGASIHYHYVSSTTSDPEAHNGTTMVHSTMTEMLANVSRRRVLTGTKAVSPRHFFVVSGFRDQQRKAGIEGEMLLVSKRTCWDRLQCPCTAEPKPPDAPFVFCRATFLYKSYSQIMIGRAVETKAELHAKAAASTEGSEQQSVDVGKSFQVCSDCPRQLLPAHVKPIPEPVCETVESLPGNAETGEVWDGELCPDWCMKQAPVSQKETQSGPVDVRECSMETRLP